MKKLKGFTLIELMIAVAIIGVLASIAYPSYQNYVISSKRLDAMAAIGDLRIAQEKYRAGHSSYGTVASLAAENYVANPMISKDGYWEISVISPSATDYTAVATHRAPHVDSDCNLMASDRSGPIPGAATLGLACWER